jgi:hypothetical protein
VQERRWGEGQGGGTFRNGTRAASPQHNGWSLAHYLPFVYYYLVGTSFETGTRSEVGTPRPGLTPRGRGTQSLLRDCCRAASRRFEN